jgi:uncharacterized membrane protein
LTLFVAVVLLAIVVAVGLAWRCYCISTRCLWYDEALSYFISRYPFDDFLSHMDYRNHPPFYFLLLKIWTQVFGISLIALRTPSMLFGLLTIIGAYLLTVEAQRSPTTADGSRPPPTSRARATGLWAATFVALSVFQIRWSWEVRMYSLGAALAVFSSWILFRALHARSGRYGLWLCYAALSVIFAYTHYFGLFTIAAQGLFVLGYLIVQTMERGKAPEAEVKDEGASFLGRLVRHPQFRPALLAAVVLLICWVPWMPIFLDQRHSTIETRNWMPPPSLKAARSYGYHLFIEPEGYVFPDSVDIAWLCVAVCIAVPLALLWKARAADWFVIVSALFPILLSLAVSAAFDMRVFYSRYFLFAQTFILVGLALLLGRSRFRWERIAVGAALVLLMLGLDVHYLRALDLPSYPSYRGVIDYIQSQRRPGEPVIVCDRRYYLPLLFHVDAAPGWYVFGNDENPEDDDRRAMGAEHVLRAENLDAIKSGRVWVVNTTALTGLSFSVEVPDGWVCKSETDFADRYGMGKRELKVLEYEVPPATEAK